MKFKPFIFIILLLAACNEQAQAITPTTTIMPVMSTHPLSATSTRHPNSTLVNSKQPTVQIETELCQSAGYLGLANDYLPNIHHSPSGKWSFVICEKKVGGDIAYPFIVFQTEGNEPWTIDTNDIASELVDKYSDTTFRPVYWTKDEKTLYVISSLPCPDSFECWIYQDAESLYKLDLESENISVILPPYISSPRFSYALSISPDEKYIAFVDQSTPSLVHIWNLASGDEKIVTLDGEFLRTGKLAWTPDSREFVFASVHDLDGVLYSSLYIYRVSDISLSTLIDNHNGVLFPNQMKLGENIFTFWYNQDILYVDSLEQGNWHLNIRTKELTPAP